MCASGRRGVFVFAWVWSVGHSMCVCVRYCKVGRGFYLIRCVFLKTQSSLKQRLFMWYLHILCARNVPQSISCLSGSGVQCRPGSELGRAAIIIRKDLLKLCKPTFNQRLRNYSVSNFLLWFHFGIFCRVTNVRVIKYSTRNALAYPLW